MQLDLIIPSFRRPSSLLVLLRSLARQTTAADVTPVIHVADNNSGDETPTVVAEFARSSPMDVQYHLVVSQGRSAAINHVARESRADWLVFIDDDEEAWPGWLAALTNAIEDSAADYFGGPCVPRFLAPRPGWVPPNWPAVIGDVAGPANRVMKNSPMRLA